MWDYCFRVGLWRGKPPCNVYNNEMWSLYWKRIVKRDGFSYKLDYFHEFHFKVYESTSADSGRHSETWGKTPRPRIHLVLPQLVQWSWQLMDCFSFPCKWSRTGGKHVVLCYKNTETSREWEFTLLQTHPMVKWRKTPHTQMGNIWWCPVLRKATSQVQHTKLYSWKKEEKNIKG